MKKVSNWIVGILMTTGTQAQSPATFSPNANPANIAADTITSYPLLVTQHMTTNLRFPVPIFRVDIGSAGVIGRKIGKTENILLLKAAKPGFPATNVSVYLDNGRLYSFLVRYADSLTSFNYSFPNPPPTTPPGDGVIGDGVIFTSAEDSKSRMDNDARLVSNTPGFMHLTRSSARLQLTLTGTYIKDDLLWLRLKATNHSSLTCKPDLVHLAEEDKHQWRRTAIQSIELPPVYIPQNTSLPTDSVLSFALALKPPTISKGKTLILEWGEKDGRRIRLSITHKKLLRSRTLKLIP